MKKIFWSSALISSIILLVFILNTFRFGDFETTLEQAGFIRNGSSDLIAKRWPVPVVYDWDGDGRKDILIGHNEESPDGSAHGRISFFRNTGSDTSPLFNGSVFLRSCSDTCTTLEISAFG